LGAIERELPAGKLIHVILDNCEHNDDPKPFRWTKPADTILDKLNTLNHPSGSVHLVIRRLLVDSSLSGSYNTTFSCSLGSFRATMACAGSLSLRLTGWWGTCAGIKMKSPAAIVGRP
jgi:hypothetical protein